MVLAPRARQTGARLGRAEWWALVRLSLMGNLIYYLLLGSAVQWAGSAATALIIGLLPVVVTVIGTRTAGAVQLRRLAAPCVLCVLCVLCVMGVALVALDTVQDDSGQQASERAATLPTLPACCARRVRWCRGRRIRSPMRAGCGGARICPAATGRCSPAWSPAHWRYCWRRPR